MISLSQILPRAQRHTSFTVTSGLAVATETGGEAGLVEGVCMCVCVVGVGLGAAPPKPSADTSSLHQQPSLMRSEPITQLIGFEAKCWSVCFFPQLRPPAPSTPQLTPPSFSFFLFLPEMWLFALTCGSRCLKQKKQSSHSEPSCCFIMMKTK